MSMSATAIPSRLATATITAARNGGQPLTGFSVHEQIERAGYINGSTANPTLTIVALALRQSAISSGR
jgi:hypothetical protein